MFVKGKSGNPNGKAKGTLSKTTVAVKEAFQLAFDGIGGVPALITWATDEKNQGEFYKLFAKLLPVQLAGSLEIKTPVIVELPAKKARE